MTTGKSLKYKTNSPHATAWATDVGRLILNCSSLELESIMWLVQMGEQTSKASISGFSKLRFDKRMKMAVALIESRSHDRRWRKETLRAWRRMAEIAKVRNQAAHNPLFFAWMSPDESGAPDHIGFPAMRKGTSELLSLTKIRSAVNESAQVCAALAALRGEWCHLRDQRKVPPLRNATIWQRVRAYWLTRPHICGE